MNDVNLSLYTDVRLLIHIEVLNRTDQNLRPILDLQVWTSKKNVPKKNLLFGGQLFLDFCKVQFNP